MTSDASARPTGSTKLILRLVPLALILLGVAAVLATGVLQHLSLEELQQRRLELLATVQAHPTRSALVYMGVYLLVVALSLPGALIMTLSGGFLFGPWWGTAWAVIGASSGAVVMFLVARTAVGDAIRRYAERTGGVLHKLERSLREHAFSALLTARLIPALPFWLVNVAGGLVKMRVRTYAAATVIGIIPSTFIYAGVGSGLNQVFEAGGRPRLDMMLQPQVLGPLIGLALLSCLPIAWKLWRKRSEVGEAPDA